jgi:hypothetical protein
MHQALEVIKRGSCWKIGNGHSINLWEDNWLIYQNGYKILTPQNGHNNLSKVEDIMLLHPSRHWNSAIIDQVFSPAEGDLIKQIPLIKEQVEDQLMWPHSKDGIYSVKTGYNILKHWKDTEDPGSTHGNPNNTLWKNLWTLQTIPRHKIMLWRILQEAIPVKSALNQRGIQCQILCPCCFQKEETIDHIFMKCQHATKIWFGSKLGVNFNNCNLSFIEWLQHTINSLNTEDLSYVAALIYGIWLARNQQVFNLRSVDNTTVIEQALRSIHEFQQATANDINNGQHSQSHISDNRCHSRRSNPNKRWARPESNKIKINCDANLAVEGRWGLGASYRNSDGALLLAATWAVLGSKDPKLAVAYALYRAVLLADEYGFQEVIFESDNSIIIDLINNGGNPRLYLGNIVNGIRMNTTSFSDSRFRSINREANKVAHELASLAHTESNKVWMNGTPPPNIVPLLIRDLLHQ